MTIMIIYIAVQWILSLLVVQHTPPGQASDESFSLMLMAMFWPLTLICVFVILVFCAVMEIHSRYSSWRSRRRKRCAEKLGS